MTLAQKLKLNQFWIASGVYILISLLGRERAVMGALLGVGSGVTGALGLFGLVKAMGGTDFQNRLGVWVVGLSILFKLPLFGFAGYLAWQGGVPGIACFTGGVVLVYSWLVWRAHSTDLY